MRITQIDIFSAAMPMKVPFRIAIGVTTTSKSLFVRIHTDTGLTGIGEGNIFTPVVGETIDTSLAAAPALSRALIGADPTDIEGRVAQMRKLLPANPTTRSAFDMALWDLLGKAASLPLFALLGGPRRTIVTDNTVGLETPETMAERAAGFVARGFTAIKVKLGTDLPTDLARMRAVRAAVGPTIDLRIDANQGWDRVTARAALAALVEFRPQLCEQPLPAWHIEGLAQLRAGSTIPLMADESVFDDHDALRIVSAGAADYINIKLAKSGGIHTALKVNAVAEAAGLPCMVGCMTDSGIAINAAVHLASARANIAFADLDGADMLGVDPVEGGFAYGPGGALTPGTGPGLGVEIDPDYLAAQEIISVS